MDGLFTGTSKLRPNLNDFFSQMFDSFAVVDKKTVECIFSAILFILLSDVI